MAKKYLAEMWGEEDDVPADCLPEFYDTPEQAQFDAILAIADAMADDVAVVMSWPRAFSVLEIDTDDEGSGEHDRLVVPRTVPTDAQCANVLKTFKGN